MKEEPILCTLTPGQLSQKRDALLPGLARRAVSVDRIEGGYEMRFDPSSVSLAAIAQVVHAERQCCRFLRFDVAVSPQGGSITMRVTGAHGTREFLDDLLTGIPIPNPSGLER
jgi:hypothetical protein